MKKHLLLELNKIEQIKICDYCYSCENLDHECNFLHEHKYEIEEQFDDSSCSNFFGKKNYEFVCGNEREIQRR